MAENGSKTITPRQALAITALLTERDVKAAAAAAKVAERTIYRWLADPIFRAQLQAAEGVMIDTATRRLIAMQDEAINAFSEAFIRSSEQVALNVAEFFTKKQVIDKVTGQPMDKLVLDIEKVTALGHLVKKLKLKGDDIEIESYDAQAAIGLKLRAAQNVLDYLLKIRDLRNVEHRLADLEKRVYAEDNYQPT